MQLVNICFLKFIIFSYCYFRVSTSSKPAHTPEWVGHQISLPIAPTTSLVAGPPHLILFLLPAPPPPLPLKGALISHINIYMNEYGRLTHRIHDNIFVDNFLSGVPYIYLSMGCGSSKM